jgi:hypothetical protein
VCVCVCVCARACAHFAICKDNGVEFDKEHWYQYVPKSVQTIHEGKVTSLWNQHMKNARTIPNNKMDIIHDN